MSEYKKGDRVRLTIEFTVEEAYDYTRHEQHRDSPFITLTYVDGTYRPQVWADEKPSGWGEPRPAVFTVELPTNPVDGTLVKVETINE